MPRSPLIINSHLIGTLYAIDLGGGGVMIMIEQDGSAINLPLDAEEARRLGQYLRPLGKPAGTVNSSTQEVLKELVDVYTSDEAKLQNGSRAKYAAKVLGIPEGTVYTRLRRAKDIGMLDNIDD